MRVSRKRMSFLLVVVIVGSLLAAAVVSATQSGPVPATEENQAAQPEIQPARGDTVIGDDPDENGYNGPIVAAAASAPAAPSEAPASATPQELLAAPGPDQQGSPDSVAAGPEWSGNFYYFFAAGSSFRPRASSTGWDYQSAGCISARSGTNIFTLHLEVPHGARIDYLRILYYDTSASNTAGYITRYDAHGGMSDLIGATSTGNAGYGYVVSNYLGHIVDTESNAYILNWIPNGTGSSIRLCGLRVAYRLP